jgi:hypothetical protein
VRGQPVDLGGQQVLARHRGGHGRLGEVHLLGDDQHVPEEAVEQVGRRPAGETLQRGVGQQDPALPVDHADQRVRRLDEGVRQLGGGEAGLSGHATPPAASARSGTGWSGGSLMFCVIGPDRSAPDAPPPRIPPPGEVPGPGDVAAARAGQVR